MEKLEIVISKSEKFIYISVQKEDNKSLSWEELQNIKDDFFRELDFIEVFPKHSEIVNKANVRHLIHIRGWECPKLSDLEIESEINIHQS